jgi:hypothetical protein
MSENAWGKVGTVVGIVLALVLYKHGSKLFSSAAAPPAARVSAGPVGTYRGPMVMHFPGDGTVQLPVAGVMFLGTVTVRGNTATLYFARGPQSPPYKDVPASWDLVGYQDWTVLEGSGGKYVYYLQRP